MASILFLAHRIPYPPNKGDKLRAYQVLEHWTRHHRVFLGCFVDDAEDLQHVDFVRGSCADAYFARLHPKWALMRSCSALFTAEPMSVSYYRHKGLAAWVDRVCESEKPDCIFVYSSVMAQYVPKPSRARFLVDFVDVDSEKWAEYASTRNFPFRQIYRREARQLLAFDRAVAARADANIFVSEAEADLFRIRAPEVREKVTAISNGVDSNYFSPENADERPNFRNRPVIVFTGHMNYWPNVDAVVWFSDSVLPKIREKFSDATFYIVGAHPSAEVQALGSRPGIVVTGKVPDVRPYIGNADVVVAPLRIGRGIQNKVLEGMAMARPVVASPEAVEGIDATHDTHLFVARDAAGFVRGIERIMDPTIAEKFGKAARERVIQLYDWNESLCMYDQLLG